MRLQPRLTAAYPRPCLSSQFTFPAEFKMLVKERQSGRGGA
jgi:hypothetical protein